MGLSSSKTKTTTNQTRTGTETTSGTQMPVTPPFLTEAAMDYVDRIGAFGEMDPNAFVAGASPLQQAAWQNALPAMSGWQGQALTASQMAQAAGTAGPNHAGKPVTAHAPAGTGGGMQAPAGPGAFQANATTYDAPSLGNATVATAQGYAAPQLGNAAQAQAGMVQPAAIGNAAQASAQGYSAAPLGRAAEAGVAQYAAPQLGNAAQAQANTFSAQQLEPAAQAGVTD